jgi:hypothetical protein
VRKKRLFCVWILLLVLFLISGCGREKTEPFPVLPNREPESVVISNGLLGVDLPPVEEEETIQALRDLIGQIDFIEKDNTEIIGGSYGVTFVCSDSSIRYDFLRDDYVAVKIDDEEYKQYRIEKENGAAIYNYLQEYVNQRG